MDEKVVKVTKGGALLKSALKGFDTIMTKLQRVVILENKAIVDLDIKVEELGRERIEHTDTVTRASKVIHNIEKIIN